MTRLLLATLLIAAAACSSGGNKSRDMLGQPNPHAKLGQPYQVKGVWYVPKAEPNYDQIGFASWYGPGFHGRLTANGEIFDEDRLTAAHPTLPLPSIVEVTNPRNGKRLKLRVNDRGPFANNRILDLSKEAARRLGTKEQGVATVRVRYIGPAKLDDAIIRVGERERGQSLYAALPSPPPLKPYRTPREPVLVNLPTETDLILADLDLAGLDMVPVSSRAELGYFVQIGAFASSGNAAAAAARLPDDEPVAMHSALRGGVPLTFVRLGPFDHSLTASEALDEARFLGFPDAHIIRGPIR